MSICFLNGEFLEENEAKVSINDAGYYFGDGIYEVILLYKGKLIDKEMHLNRLLTCFKKVYFKNTPSESEVLNNITELLKRNPTIDTASIYIQFTRGEAIRSHSFSNLNLNPSCLIKLIPCEVVNNIKMWSCNIIDDPRRQRCDIKMISLLPMVLSKYESEQQGYDDVIFYNKNVNSITEGSSFNIFIVNKNNEIITCPIGNEILPGCTRARIIQICKENNYNIIERYYTKEELYNAKEIFITGSIKLIVSVVKVNNQKINNGTIGNITRELNNKLFEFLES